MRRAFGLAHGLGLLVLILLGMFILSCSPSSVGGTFSPLPSPILLETVQSPPATPTPLPTPTSLTLPPTFEPPTLPPTVTLLPLPAVTPSDARLEVWVTRPTYSEPPPFLEVEFETAKWTLSDDPAYPILVHRELTGCQIAPDVGRGLPEDYSVSQTFKEMGGITYQLNAVSSKGELVYINYCAHDVTENVSTCFGVSFQDDQETCIQDAEAVLLTLQVIYGSGGD